MPVMAWLFCLDLASVDIGATAADRGVDIAKVTASARGGYLRPLSLPPGIGQNVDRSVRLAFGDKISNC